MADEWQSPTPPSPTPPGPTGQIPYAPPAGPAYPPAYPPGYPQSAPPAGPAYPPAYPPGYPQGYPAAGPAYPPGQVPPPWATPGDGPGGTPTPPRRLPWWGWTLIALVGAAAFAGAWILVASLLARSEPTVPPRAGATQAPALPAVPTPATTPQTTPRATPRQTDSTPRMSSPTSVPATDRAVATLASTGPHHVRFEVWGPAREQVDIVVNGDETDEHDFDAQSLPWAVETDVDPMIETLSVEVYADYRRDTPVSCRITADGVVVTEATGLSWAGCWVDVQGIYNH